MCKLVFIHVDYDVTAIKCCGHCLLSLSLPLPLPLPLPLLLLRFHFQFQIYDCNVIKNSWIMHYYFDTAICRTSAGCACVDCIVCETNSVERKCICARWRNFNKFGILISNFWPNNSDKTWRALSHTHTLDSQKHQIKFGQQRFGAFKYCRDK